jgi:endo-1,4-beta-xylanase
VAFFFEGTPIGVAQVYVDAVSVLALTTNLVTNSGFETDTSGWQSWNGSTLSASSAQAYEGSQSLRATGRADTGQFAVYNLTSAVEPDNLYAVRARVRHDSGSNTTIRLAAKIDCTALTMPVGFNEFPWVHNNTAVVTATWTELSGTLAIPDCDLVDVAIFFEGTPISVTDVFIDSVKVLGP